MLYFVLLITVCFSEYVIKEQAIHINLVDIIFRLVELSGRLSYPRVGRHKKCTLVDFVWTLSDKAFHSKDLVKDLFQYTLDALDVYSLKVLTQTFLSVD